MKDTLVSIIVPTFNSSATLAACLQSLKDQTYKKIEIIVVDNHSSDETFSIANNFTNKVFLKGPERSSQRNYGVLQSDGDYVAIIDSDMELTKHVIRNCISAIKANAENCAVIIPEESFGTGFWSKCKTLERSYYVGNDSIEAARFFPKNIYEVLGGYNENLISGEDWDLSNRAKKMGNIIHIDQFIRHNEGNLKLSKSLKKKFYYARQSKAYFINGSHNSGINGGAGPIARYKLFFSDKKRF